MGEHDNFDACHDPRDWFCAASGRAAHLRDPVERQLGEGGGRGGDQLPALLHKLDVGQV